MFVCFCERTLLVVRANRNIVEFDSILSCLVKEQTLLRILHHPRQSLLEIASCHCAAWEDMPAMCSYRFQLQFLCSKCQLIVLVFIFWHVPRESLLPSYNLQHPSCSRKRASLPLQDAVPLVSNYPPANEWCCAPLLKATLEARLGSLECVDDPLHQQPISMHLSFQSSFSSMIATFSGHPRPLESQHTSLETSKSLQNTHMLSLYLFRSLAEFWWQPDMLTLRNQLSW